MMKLRSGALLSGLLFVLAGLVGCSQGGSSKELVLYSARNDQLLKPLLDLYQQKHDITFQLITDNEAALLERLKSEGENTPADLLITVDAGNLWLASQEGVLTAVDSDVLKSNIPDYLRASNDEWYGLSVRARAIVYATDRVNPDELVSYEGLADPKWAGRLCLRTSKKVYNQSLVATMIATLGEEQTENIVSGWVDNLATDPHSSDTRMMEAIAAGQCDVGIGNTYYLGRLQRNDPDINLAFFWPNQDDRGTHVNVSGAGVTKHSDNKKAAIEFLEWLSSDEAQEIYAQVNLEYPAKQDIPVDPIVDAWGDFKPDVINVEQAGELQADAIRLMDRVNYR